MWETKFHIYTEQQVIFYYFVFLFFKFLGGRHEDENSELHDSMHKFNLIVAV
jgi:hypothetical protein